MSGRAAREVRGRMQPQELTMTKSLAEISKAMRAIDFAMLNTVTAGGAVAARPMSNNGDVEYDGDSYFFTDESAGMVQDIAAHPQVGLSFAADKGLLGKPGIFIAIEGDAELIRDKARFAEHWRSDLERWYPEGVETAGLVLIKVHAARVTYWDGDETADVPLADGAARGRSRGEERVGLN
jgi:general stress protein 26